MWLEANLSMASCGFGNSLELTTQQNSERAFEIQPQGFVIHQFLLKPEGKNN